MSIKNPYYRWASLMIALGGALGVSACAGLDDDRSSRESASTIGAGATTDQCKIDPASCQPPPDPCTIDPSSCQPPPPDPCTIDPSSCQPPPPDPCVIDPASCQPPPDPCVIDPASCQPPPDPCTVTIINADESPMTLESIQGLPWGFAEASQTGAGYEVALAFAPTNHHFTIVLPGGDPGGASEHYVAQSSYCVDNTLFLNVTIPMPLTVYAGDGPMVATTTAGPTPAFAAPPAAPKEGRNVVAAAVERSSIVGNPGALPPGAVVPGVPECVDKVEWVLYPQASYNNKDVYTGPAPGADNYLNYSRRAIAAAGKAVSTVDNLAGGAAATRWGPVITAAAANRKHMSLGHGNISLALATTNDTLQDNNANVGIAGAAVGAINDVEWFHCCTGARFTVQEPDGMGGMRPFRDQMLRSYRRAMPAAAASVSGWDQMVGASDTNGMVPAKLWLVKGGNKRTATGAN